MSHTKTEQGSSSPVERVSSPSTPTTSITPTASAEQTVINIPSETSSIRSRRSFSMRQSEGERSNLSDQQSSQQQSLHSHHHLRPQSDVSYDEDTSSTSGYRESYSMHIVSLDNSTGSRQVHGPPLASPDLNDMPSTSSTATNYIAYDGSSPDCSINGSGGEKAALITSTQQSNSQHSLVMVFQPQDEDTLI